MKKKLRLSNHAAKRIRQRGIPAASVELMVEQGRCRPRNGALVFYMDKRSRKAAQRVQKGQDRASAGSVQR